MIKNKQVLLLLLALFILALVLGFLWVRGRQQSRETSPRPAPTPIIKTPLTPAPTPSPTTEETKQTMLKDLPFTGDGFTIQYFPKDDLFFVLINKPPYVFYEQEVKNWFLQRGFDSEKLNIQWTSTRGIAP